MLHPTYKRLRLEAIRPSSSEMRASPSYDRLPTSEKSEERLQQRRRYLTHKSLVFLLVLLFLIICRGVRVGLLPMFWESEAYPLLLDASIDSLSEGLTLKKFTSVDLVKSVQYAYLARIEEVHSLHAVTEVNPDALSIAAELDRERSAGATRGPLHGLPILIKNTITTDDRLNTTAGSWALLGARVSGEATVARKLRAAGAIILGKTNLSQWSEARSANTSSGWSALGGQVYGPYVPNQNPLGSSSGSGVASALGLAAGCLGSETDGSITLPSSFNNIVGIKPTVGITSRHLAIPVSEHQDSIGPMARSVKDAAHILQAIAGVDPLDNYTSAIPNGFIPDYVSACDLSGLSSIRLGIPRNVFPYFIDQTNRPMMEAFELALEIMREAGATIVEGTNFTAADEYMSDDALAGLILRADMRSNLDTYLQSLTYNPENITSLADLRHFTHFFPQEEYPVRDTVFWDLALESWNNTDPHFWPHYQRYLYYGEEGGLLGALKRHDLDAILMPANFAPHWAAPIGGPIVTVPLGQLPDGTPVVKDSWGLVQIAPKIPFGISFLGAKFSETKLIGMAYAFEQRTLVRDKLQPYIRPSSELADVLR